MDIIHKGEEENGHNDKSLFYRNQLVSRCSQFTPPKRSQAGNRQPYKRRLKPLVFLDVIFLVFLEGKVGHLFLEGKVGQPVHNLLQVTVRLAFTL
ncbi:hypothetical protein A6770_38970 [Nostoc minutum NIES-26]|uniref:Uncharacterized protein n=1 Tax=Nostoc minutum NIES-26 TaxID=1844469 RepID=A0A367RRI3_9NOSO|nr:hypothetical protein A6770_38970 [Nostoc minutum NIES-26]